MEITYLKSRSVNQQSFTCGYEKLYGNERLHCHNGYELRYVLQNNGTFFTGDSIDNFNEDHLILIGPGLQHSWRSCQEEDSQKSDKIPYEGFAIHFERDFLSADFLDMPEMTMVRDMLINSKRGILFNTQISKKLKASMLDFSGRKDWEQLVNILFILCELAESGYKLLASRTYTESLGAGHDERVNSIYRYLIQNYQKEITLQEIADFANMNPTAFCRYFKKMTSSTFSQSLNRVRVDLACKKILDTHLSLSEIGYSCGYQSISYFNRQFKKVKKVSPSFFRAQYTVKE